MTGLLTSKVDMEMTFTVVTISLAFMLGFMSGAVLIAARYEKMLDNLIGVNHGND